MMGAVCYVDLFAGDLSGIKGKIPYLKELGITYLHLMPLFTCPEGENDGGYAISSYRDVRSDLGSTSQLKELASELQENGISLVLDFVFNHTSDEHEWALKAKQGDAVFEKYYWIFPDRKIPDQYETHLREIFPNEHPGAFTYFKGIQKWVWTTFHSYQWDLNYQNPAVFVSMAREMLALANLGVDALRLDAVAFIWKQMGTNCENLPEAHLLIQAFNLVARIAAPGLIFKSEAIVHPDDVVKYISPAECQISYNPLLMALLWESLATRQVRLLVHSMQKRLAIPEGCSWVNYVRCHDDIGWTFSDDDAAELWMNGYDHRQFLNEFYRGRFPGSFARGLPFQENPKTGDCRISGTCASLAGLEKAITEETSSEVELAIKRILLIHGVILTMGGIPLLYLGDELGLLNDYSYRDDPGKADDSRWVHRPKFDWKKATQRNKPGAFEEKIFNGLLNLIRIRKENPVFANLNTEMIGLKNEHVLAYKKPEQLNCMFVLANFSERPQNVSLIDLKIRKATTLINLLTGGTPLKKEILLNAYDLAILREL
jgi:glycosidase